MHHSAETASAQTGFREHVNTVRTGRPGRARTRVGVIGLALTALLGSGLAAGVVVAGPAAAGINAPVGAPGGGSNGPGAGSGNGGDGRPSTGSGVTPNGWGYGGMFSTAGFRTEDRNNPNRTANPTERLGVRLSDIKNGPAWAASSYEKAGRPCLTEVSAAYETAGNAMVSRLAIGVKYVQQIRWAGPGNRASETRLAFAKSTTKGWKNFAGVRADMTKSDFGCVQENDFKLATKECGVGAREPIMKGPFGNGTGFTVDTAPTVPSNFVKEGTDINVGVQVFAGFGNLWNSGSWVSRIAEPGFKTETWKSATKTRAGRWVKNPYPLFVGKNISQSPVRAFIHRTICGPVQFTYSADVPESIESVGLWRGEALAENVRCTSVELGEFKLKVLDEDGKGKEKVVYDPRREFPANNCATPQPHPAANPMMIFCDNAGEFRVAGPRDLAYDEGLDFAENRAKCKGETATSAVCVVPPTADTFGEKTIFADGKLNKLVMPQPSEFREIDGSTGLPTGSKLTNPRNFSTSWKIKEGSTPSKSMKGLWSDASSPVKADRDIDGAVSYPLNKQSAWDNIINLQFFRASSPVGLNSVEVVPLTISAERSFVYDRLQQMWRLTSGGKFAPVGDPVRVPTKGSCSTSATIYVAGSRVSN